MLSEREFRGVLERLVAAYWNGTYEEWREAMHLLAADTSPEQWEEVVRRLRGGRARGRRPRARRAGAHSRGGPEGDLTAP
jgi:hypothetical protein